MGWHLGLEGSPDGRPLLLEAALSALGPVGYWKLNETSGLTAFDSSGNGRHGTYHPSVVLSFKSGPAGLIGDNRYPYFAQTSAAGVTIADNNDWSPSVGTPLTFVCLQAYNSLGTFPGHTLAYKADEWVFGATNIGTMITTILNTISGVYMYKEAVPTHVYVPTGGVGWALSFCEMRVGEPYMWHNNIVAPIGAVSLGPVGTQRGNTGSSLALSFTGPTPETRKRYLAHCAIYQGSLSDGDRAGISAAAIADGWI